MSTFQHRVRGPSAAVAASVNKRRETSVAGTVERRSRIAFKFDGRRVESASRTSDAFTRKRCPSCVRPTESVPHYLQLEARELTVLCESVMGRPPSDVKTHDAWDHTLGKKFFSSINPGESLSELEYALKLRTNQPAVLPSGGCVRGRPGARFAGASDDERATDDSTSGVTSEV